jgi:glycine/D-amino acid oxidase-like deaminating enzyme/nitrite reductase/ring-hydroxylating ferredoxin subunit
MSRLSTSPAGSAPYWQGSTSFPTFPAIDHDLIVDVVVIGGGITGLTAAYLLSAEGRSVALLERGRCAEVDTGHTSAHLTMVTDLRLTELEQRIGRTHAQAVWDAGLAAIFRIEAIAGDTGTVCDFAWVEGYLHTPADDRHGHNDRQRQDRDFTDEAALASACGFDVAFLQDVPFVGGPGIRFADQARFNPLKYLAGLAGAICTNGGNIFEHSPADEFSASPLSVSAGGYRVHAADIVIATHNPLVGIASTVAAALFQTKLALYTSYAVAGRVAPGTLPDALFWDTASPYRYLRLEPHGGHDLVIFGGEDHRTGQVSDTVARYDRLEKAITAKTGISLTHRWSGQVIATPDGLPYIGRMTDHQYAATGFSGNGLTFGTLAGLIISDAILGRPNPWAELFDPHRAAVRRGLWDYIKENAAYPYYMMRDRLRSAERGPLRSVGRGRGRTIDSRGEKVAAYRSPEGVLALRSAVCTHMGCVVAWNEVEHSWDCPCHGSRFTATGAVISGPAEAPLPEIRSSGPEV